MSKKETVLILGASDKEDRYSYKAMKLLEEHGHKTVLVHPRLTQIEGRVCYPSIKEIGSVKIDTLTMYVNSEISSKSTDAIVKLKPGRVIFNPGTENPELMESLKKAKISYEEACTLVLLNTNQY